MITEKILIGNKYGTGIFNIEFMIPRNMILQDMKLRWKVAWIASLLYIAYLFAGQVPQLRNTPYFSSMIVSFLLIVVYLISSLLLTGWKKSLQLLALGWLVGYSMEFLSINTGIPFGTYYYTAALGPKLGPVPIFIPFLWSSLFFYAMEASSIFLAPFLMVTFDLSFDPRYSKELWHWTVPTQYFGDPVSNFIGWFLVSLLIAFILYLLNFKINNSGKTILPALVFYILFGLDNTISDYRAGLGEAGMISMIIIMVIFLLLLLTKYFKSSGKMGNIRNLQ